MQNKAPIRSQAVGPATLGERSDRIDRSMPRQNRQSQHGSDSAGVQGHLRLSIPTISLATHALLDLVFGEQFAVARGRVV